MTESESSILTDQEV